MKKAPRKIFSVLLIALFAAQNVLCVELPLSSSRNSDKLAPPSLFQSSFAGEDSAEFKNSVISDISLTTALFSIAFNYLEDRPQSAKNKDLGIMLRNEFRNNKPALDTLKNINLNDIKFDDGIVTIPVNYRGKNYRVRICRKDRFASLDKTGSEWALSVRFAIQVKEINGIDAGLIGHGFTAQELDNVNIVSWKDHEGFRKALDELEAMIRERAPPIFPQYQGLLDTIPAFKKNDRRMGVIEARYSDTDHYYLGVGTSKSLGVASLFFDKKSKFYKYRQEALFHEIFHAWRSMARNGQEDIELDIEAHRDALRLAAQMFWGLTREQTEWISLAELESHPANGLGVVIRDWKIGQSKIPERMRDDDWKSLLEDMRYVLKNAVKRNQSESLVEFLKACDESASAGENSLYPIESRYPLLRAVALLEKDEQDSLLEFIKYKCDKSVRSLPIVDSIILMLNGEIADDWLENQAPNLSGRNIYQVSSEIWYAAGGLGRVMQYHGKAMHEILKKFGVKLRHVEPMYSRRPDPKNKGVWVPLDYHSNVLSYPINGNMQVVERFPVSYGSLKNPRITEAIGYLGHNELGIEAYLIKDKDDFATGSIYRYGDGATLPTWEQFTSFLSRSSLELIRRLETKERKAHPDKWKAPVVHVNDSQTSLFGLDMIRDDIYFQDESGARKRYRDDDVTQSINLVATTHTYKNRQLASGQDGKKMVEAGGVSSAYWDYLERDYKSVFDYASCLLRTAIWRGGVSRKHVQDVRGFDSWWPGMNLIAVTNGDDRESTAVAFRKIMKSLYPESDIEHPTPLQVRQTKRKAKEDFAMQQNSNNSRYYSSNLSDKEQVTLNPDQPVFAYTGRLVPEKAGMARALCDRNIEELLKRGAQVIIAGNVQAYDDSRRLEEDLIRLVSKFRDNDSYKGRLIFIPYFDINEQREILALSDFGVLDSDPNTEAAGFSETDFAVCGGIVVAPPWANGEGILVNQGIRIDLNVVGEGNTMIPKVAHTADVNTLRDAYLKIMMDGLDMSEDKLSEYQATSVRLSRVLEARLTAAEYLRQWSRAVGERKAALKALGEAKITKQSAGEVIKVMDMVYDIDTGLYPSVDDEKTLYKVVELDLVPVAMRAEFVNMVTRLNNDHPELKEKIEIVNDRQDLVGRISELAADPNNIVTAAVASEDCLSRLPQGVKALLFKNENDGADSFRQVECILAALRALYQDDARALIRLYEIASGEKFILSEKDILDVINDPQALAKKIVFNLKPISVENEEMLNSLNSRVIDLIKQSA